jgi:valyl-tRNA synthetase
MAGHLYYVRYPLAGEKDKYITVATTRPETILGDTAVAVNPHDERFKGMMGKKAILPAIGRAIPIVADETVDPAFGTGAVKITPAHDPVDFDVAQRHDLPLVNILNSNAALNENAGKYAGLDRFAGRKALLADLEKDGLLVKVEDYNHAVGHCHRCTTVIEPIASQQWFVDTKPLAGPAIEAVTSGQIKIIPERFNKVYLNWMENIRDWCISRQLWWGHRIPVWYCRDCGRLTVAVDEPESCSGCHSANIEQDPDVLDTWFSSGLWPHSALGWPDDTEDLLYFYPTSVMETGYDIIFFWVARMIMMGLKNTGRSPFHTVFLHGLVRDEKGEKMSKVKGNVLNPLDTLEKYGTDALRFALSTGTSPGNDFKVSPAKLEAGRNFANKLWNAARFVIRSIDAPAADMTVRRGELPPEDRWILSRLSRTVTSVTGLMEEYQFGEAQRQLHDFWWGQFCDWYIELAKVRLRQGEGTVSPVPVLVHVTETVLRLLHPFMPFITEELWQNLKSRLPTDQRQAESIMVAEYPRAVAGDVDAEAEKVIDAVIEVIHAIRNARAQHKVAAARCIEAAVYTGGLTAAITPYGEAIQALAKVKPLAFRTGKRPAGAGKNELVLVLGEAEVVIPMATMVDMEAEGTRRQEEIADVKAEVARLEARLNDKAFTAKAPSSVVEGFRSRLAAQIERLKRL